jgi:hypothetical protein
MGRGRGSRGVVQTARAQVRNPSVSWCVYTFQMPDCMKGEEMEPKSVMIGVLVVAVAVLGYLYWESQQSKVEINVPGVSIKAK